MQVIYRFIRSMFGMKHWYARSHDALQAELTEIIRLAYKGIDSN